MGGNRNTTSSNLDLVEKYCILSDLHEQILALMKKSPTTKKSKEIFNFGNRNSIIQGSYLSPKKLTKEALISSPGYNLTLYNMTLQ